MKRGQIGMNKTTFDILQEGAKITDERRKIYGPPVPNMKMTARLWSDFLGTEIQP